MKSAISTLCTTVIATTATTAAWAAAGPRAEGVGLLTWLFLGFGALIVVGQCVPALVLFVSMVRSLFTGTAPEKARGAR